jgi:hypothetical protein
MEFEDRTKSGLSDVELSDKFMAMFIKHGVSPEKAADCVIAYFSLVVASRTVV